MIIIIIIIIRILRDSSISFHGGPDTKIKIWKSNKITKIITK